MGIADAAQQKAQAKVSELEATIAALKAELSQAKNELKGASALDDAVDTVTNPEKIREVAQPLRDKTDSLVATSQAKVDKIQADLTTAAAKLSAYETAQGAIDAVAGLAEPQLGPPSFPTT